jgi:hypothetical protein
VQGESGFAPSKGLLTAADDRVADSARVATAFIAGLIIWLPLQTPITALLYQYGHLPVVAARGLLLAKDVAVALAVVLLLFHTWRSVRLRWFDIAALVYVALVVAYSVVPISLGSKLPLVAVIASAREFVMPVELYVLGRLVVAAGVDLRFIVRVLLGVAAVAALATVGLYFVPATFWNTTVDLVTFEREVQGIANAVSLWDIGLLGQFGVGDAGTFTRAIGPFTHPVGTAHYFVLPLVIAACAVMRSWQLGAYSEGRRYLLLVGLFAAAVVTPISRGGWLTAAIALVLAAVIFRRIRATLLVLLIVGAALAVVPPFSYSISSALSRTDSSVIGHQQAIDEGAQIVAQNPVGLGLGQADHFGQALAGGTGASAGVGENIYLALLVSVGPLGFLMFAAWVLGTIPTMIGSRDPTIGWIAVAVGCALVGYLVGGVLASPLMRFTTSSTVWLIIGMTVGTLSAVSRTAAEPRGPSPSLNPPVGRVS